MEGEPWLRVLSDGTDYGTGGVRVGLFDREGSGVIFHTVEFETPEEIAGIGVDPTGSRVLALDEQDRHLRPAIMWMDICASDQAAGIQRTSHPALKYNGFGAVSAEWGLPNCLWLKEQEPRTWQQARRVWDAADWLVNRLTGEWAASVNIAAAKHHHDRDEGGFPLTLLGQIGLGVVEPGKQALITGASHHLLGQVAEPIHGHGFWGAYTDAVTPGQYTVEAGQACTGTVVAWFKNRFRQGSSGWCCCASAGPRRTARPARMSSGCAWPTSRRRISGQR
jgi:ribulose kinase